MTGQGSAMGTVQDRLYRIDLRTLNNKYLDIRTYLPAELQSYELEIRQLLADQLHRGSIRLEVQSQRTAPPVARSMAGQRSAGTRRMPEIH